MTWPTVAVNTANMDAGTDNPATARTDILDALTKQNQMIAHPSSFMQGHLADATAAAARTTLGAAAAGALASSGITGAQPAGSYAASGANSDITSLNAPALGSATATTQASTDNTTKVATTAIVQSVALGGSGKSWGVQTRAFGTTYTAPAYPIVLKVQSQSSASPGGGVGVSINGGSVINISWGAAQTVGQVGIGEIVIPANATYLMSAIGASTSITTAWELR